MKTTILDSPNPDAEICPACGRQIPSGAAAGLCPSCLPADSSNLHTPPSGPELKPAAEWGDFTLIEEIGRGGMGIVWRAQQRSLDRQVALKVILKGSFATPAERDRFQSEAQAAAALNHPNIVPVYEVGEIGGQPYYAMKLVEDGSLADRLEQGVLKPRDAAALIVRLARGIHYAHQHGILHRDLKPGNILIEQGDPMVTDFGLAKRLDGSRDVTVAGSVLGSPNYMSPEQAAGASADISTATDVYSLGAILYHLLTGEPPFRAETPLATLGLVMRGDPPSPRVKNSNVDRNLANVCLKCLAKDPERRYASADALREDLERWLRHEPVSARRAPAWERAWKLARRHPASTAAGVAAVLTAAAGMWAVHMQYLRTEQALGQARINALAERSARAAVIDPHRIQRFGHAIESAALSSDRQRIAFSVGTNAAILTLDSEAPARMLTGHTSFVRLVKWSGDGRRLISASTFPDQPNWDSPPDKFGDQTARIWDSESDRLVGTIPSPFVEPLSSIAINATGDHVGLASVDGGLGVWRVGDAEPLFVTQVSTGQVLQAQFHFTGSSILASTSGNHVWIRRKHPGGGTFGSSAFSDDHLVRAFDLNGRLITDFPTGYRGLRLRGASMGLPASPTVSSRATFALSPTGEHLVTAAVEPDYCALWTAATGERLIQLRAVTKPLTRAAFSRDGRLVAAGSEDQTALVWHVADGKLAGVLRPHPREVTGVAFSKDPRWVLTVCADTKLRVWDLESGVCVAILKGHRGIVTFADFFSDGNEIVSTSADGTVRFWRWETFDQMAIRVAGHTAAVHSIRFDARGTRVVTGSADGTARISETKRGTHLIALDPTADLGDLARNIRNNGAFEMMDARFTPDDLEIITARSDAKLALSQNPLSVMFSSKFPPKKQPFLPGRLWSALDGSEVGAVAGGKVAFVNIEFSPIDSYVLFRGETTLRTSGTSGALGIRSSWMSKGGGPIAELLLWDREMKATIATLDAGARKLFAAGFHPVDGRIWTATDIELRIWDPDGQTSVPVPGARGREWTAFSADGSRILSQTEDHHPALWDAVSLKKLATFESPEAPVSFAWFSGEDGTVGALMESGRLVTWDAETGDVGWEGDSSGRQTGKSVASADRRWMAAVVNDQEIDLWDLRQRRLIRTIERHVHAVTALEFSANGKWLGTGDASGEVWLWPLDLAER